ncbi:hypothetical protein SAMN05216387_101449 [Nitrosovibrio tenuis]|uniref:Uncharacterized protein n=1 Tax=Nitrosovibrio tenuis TaxID=1233 RepID=A0A1H7H1W3_9PROT|nr:hypothetical protein SAMN05216387_101449 [Nitrosovibrio tenuis]
MKRVGTNQLKIHIGAFKKPNDSRVAVLAVHENCGAGAVKQVFLREQTPPVLWRRVNQKIIFIRRVRSGRSQEEVEAGQCVINLIYAINAGVQYM